MKVEIIDKVYKIFVKKSFEISLFYKQQIKNVKNIKNFLDFLKSTCYNKEAPEREEQILLKKN